MDNRKILDTLADLRRRVTAPWRRGDTPLELRKALLEELMERTVPVAPGQRVLGFDRVRIELYPSDPEDAFVLREALPTWRREMLEAMAQRLGEVGCSNQQVELQLELIEDAAEPDGEADEAMVASGAARDENAGGVLSPGAATLAAQAGGRYALYFERSERGLGELAAEDVPDQPVLSRGGTDAETASSLAVAADGAPAQQARGTSAPGLPTIEIEVVRGKAERDVYRFALAKIYIGRTAEVLDGHGRLRRRNHLAFDDQDEASATVSREHARLLFRSESERTESERSESSGSAALSGSYWLVDERSAHGTRVFRNGRSFDVSPRDRRGVLIKQGDEIYFGRTVVRCSFLG